MASSRGASRCVCGCRWVSTARSEAGERRERDTRKRAGSVGRTRPSWSGRYCSLVSRGTRGSESDARARDRNTHTARRAEGSRETEAIEVKFGVEEKSSRSCMVRENDEGGVGSRGKRRGQLWIWCGDSCLQQRAG